MRNGWMAFLLASLALAGCLGGDTDGDDGDDGAVPATAPGGCAVDRPAVVHGVDGQPAPGGAALQVPAPSPCEYRLGVGTFEPTIGVDSAGSVYYYPASGLGLPAPVSMARSTDEGQTWDIITPGTAGVATHPYSQDPYLYLDPDTDRIFAEDLLLVPPTCGMMSFSDDGGETWMHTQSGCAQVDHVTLFAGPPVTSTTIGYPNVVYRCAISGGALAGASTMVTCQRSIDGGMTWLAPGAPPWVFAPGATTGIVPGSCSGGNGHGFVDEAGIVYLPRGHCGQPELAISRDEGMTWTTVQVSDRGNACTSADFCEHDAGVGMDADGHLYYAWVGGDRLPYVVRSDDGGATWGTPRMVGPPGLNEAALIQMAVGKTGHLVLAYYGTHTGPGAPFDDYSQTTWNATMAIITDAHTDTPTVYTATINPPADAMIRGACGPLRCDAAFDFIDVRIGPDGTPWAAFADGCFEACNGGEGPDGNEAVVGRLWGGPHLTA